MDTLDDDTFEPDDGATPTQTGEDEPYDWSDSDRDEMPPPTSTARTTTSGTSASAALLVTPVPVRVLKASQSSQSSQSSQVARTARGTKRKAPSRDMTEFLDQFKDTRQRQLEQDDKRIEAQAQLQRDIAKMQLESQERLLQLQIQREEARERRDDERYLRHEEMMQRLIESCIQAVGRRDSSN